MFDYSKIQDLTLRKCQIEGVNRLSLQKTSLFKKELFLGFILDTIFFFLSGGFYLSTNFGVSGNLSTLLTTEVRLKTTNFELMKYKLILSNLI